ASELDAQLNEELVKNTLNDKEKNQLALHCLRLAEFYLHIERAPVKAQRFIHFAYDNLTDKAQRLSAARQLAFLYQQLIFSTNKELREMDVKDVVRID